MNSNEEKNTAKSSTKRYKSIRIKNEDYRLLRKYGYENEVPLVEALSTAIKLLIENEKDQ